MSTEIQDQLHEQMNYVAERLYKELDELLYGGGTTPMRQDTFNMLKAIMVQDLTSELEFFISKGNIVDADSNLNQLRNVIQMRL